MVMTQCSSTAAVPRTGTRSTSRGGQREAPGTVQFDRRDDRGHLRVVESHTRVRTAAEVHEPDVDDVDRPGTAASDDADGGQVVGKAEVHGGAAEAEDGTVEQDARAEACGRIDRDTVDGDGRGLVGQGVPRVTE